MMNKRNLFPFMACLVLIAAPGCSNEESSEPTPAAAERESAPAPKPAALEKPEAAAAPSNDAAVNPPPGSVDVAQRDAINVGSVAFQTAMCVKCHGDDATGTKRAPDLTDDEWLHVDGSVEQIRALIVAGVPKDKLKDPDRPFAMNPVTNFIQDEKQIDALAAYVHSLGHDD
jgi:mono/diheme cytochrome c family protein